MKNIIVLSCLLAPLASHAQFYDFETCSTSTVNAPNFLPGLYITHGFASGTVSVGSTISWSQTLNGFRCSGAPSIAWSGTKTLYTDSAEDTLIRLDTKAKQVSILSDRGTPEGPDAIRLVGLRMTANNTFQVVAFDQKSDDATTIAGCTLSISVPAGVDYLLLDTTTENEAWDNLTVTAVPEPTTLTMLIGGVAFVVRRRVRVKST